MILLSWSVLVCKRGREGEVVRVGVLRPWDLTPRLALDMRARRPPFPKTSATRQRQETNTHTIFSEAFSKE